MRGGTPSALLSKEVCILFFTAVYWYEEGGSPWGGLVNTRDSARDENDRPREESGEDLVLKEGLAEYGVVAGSEAALLDPSGEASLYNHIRRRAAMSPEDIRAVLESARAEAGRCWTVEEIDKYVADVRSEWDGRGWEDPLRCIL